MLLYTIIGLIILAIVLESYMYRLEGDIIDSCHTNGKCSTKSRSCCMYTEDDED